MEVEVHIGDVLDHVADALICTANPWLNMSGGVNGAVLARCGSSIQSELRDYLTTIGKPAVPAGTVVCTSAGSLSFAHIIHAVAIDPFYDSSIELVRETLTSAFDLAGTLNALTVAMPTLATGYGPLSIESFAAALADVVVKGCFSVERVAVVVRSSDNAKIINSALTITR
jgi:O-acetyl-ADP-ribose deacetylase (regulator of RNase III)